MYLFYELNDCEMANFKYVSCIKIAGTPILPPLISEKERELVSQYKEKAIQIEEKLNRTRMNNSLDINDSERISGNTSELDSDSLETSKVMDFIRQALFDVGHSDVKLLQEQILEEMKNIKMPSKSNSCDTLHLIEDLSLSEDKVEQRKDESSCSFRTPTEFPSNKTPEEKSTPKGQNISKSSSDSPFLYHSPSKSDYSNSYLKSPENVEKKTEDNVNNNDNKTPPKLVRSNSYTLDSPSPSVLIYLKSLRKSHSDTCSGENKVVKNLNDLWDKSEDNKHNYKGQLPKSQSYQNPLQSNISSLSDQICDNQKIFENVTDNNSNVKKNKLIIHSDKSISLSEAINKGKNLSDQTLYSVTLEKEKAIIVIQAGIRGYLTRRLMKTNKVKELRNTIKDSLICALALHSEQNVTSADVNLHVRLIRQVTAACYELHSIFFEYTPQQKMQLIRLDREKLLSIERTKINLRKLKAITSDDEGSKNGLSSPTRGGGKLKRPSSLPLTRTSRHSLRRSIR